MEKKLNLNPKSYEGTRFYSPNMGHGSRLFIKVELIKKSFIFI
jgi:hypothetical protein